MAQFDFNISYREVESFVEVRSSLRKPHHLKSYKLQCAFSIKIHSDSWAGGWWEDVTPLPDGLLDPGGRIVQLPAHVLQVRHLLTIPDRRLAKLKELTYKPPQLKNFVSFFIRVFSWTNCLHYCSVQCTYTKYWEHIRRKPDSGRPCGASGGGTPGHRWGQACPPGPPWRWILRRPHILSPCSPTGDVTTDCTPCRDMIAPVKKFLKIQYKFVNAVCMLWI